MKDSDLDSRVASLVSTFFMDLQKLEDKLKDWQRLKESMMRQYGSDIYWAFQDWQNEY